jgi:hypothetical protein
MMPAADFWRHVENALDRRISDLRQRSRDDLLALCGDEAHDLSHEGIEGKIVTLTLFTYRHSERAATFIVQAGVKAFLGLGYRSMEKGFVLSEDGTITVASEEEIRAVL